MFSQISKSLVRNVRGSKYNTSRLFHASRRVEVVKPFLLADIGEGIRECEVIQWFVEPEARVEEFDKICEVQSDKASVDIPSRFSGVIKKLHYDAGEMALVGKPLVDIDVQDEVAESPLLEPPPEIKDSAQQSNTPDGFMAPKQADTIRPTSDQTKRKIGRHATLATPAVRHLTKELIVDISEVEGTGKDGRVTKEDVYNFASARDSQDDPMKQTRASFSTLEPDNDAQEETTIPLTNHQTQMFKTMTRSLAIPHFLYADEVDLSSLSRLRKRLNNPPNESLSSKISYLPFIIKAISLTLLKYPILNARVESSKADAKPQLVYRSRHNVGVAMDTPSGLLVPVVKDVESHSVSTIGRELSRLQDLASKNKLSTADLSGGTITLSNIGSIGGTYVSPIIVDREMAILGMGRMRVVPAFADDGTVMAKTVCNFSWSADHRVIDGATMARAAELVRCFVENPDEMIVHLR